MRKQVFTLIDAVLPRAIAISPYWMSLLFVRVLVKLGCGFEVQVWNRNSTKLGAYVFGVSDLDLTIIYRKGSDLRLLPAILKISKALFIFIGEVNLYLDEDLKWILPKMNKFELERDPLLVKGWNHHDLDAKVEKIVFLLRMLFVDIHSLKKEPKARQKKWKQHLESNHEISLDLIIKSLADYLDNSRLIEALQLWSQQVNDKNFNVYEANLGEGFKILAPHCHVWFRDEWQDKKLLSTLSDFEKKLLIRQIDWEEWGIYSQKLWLNQNHTNQHLERLRRVQSLLS